MSPEILLDPIKFFRACWPHLSLYDKQVEIIESVVNNDATIVPAGNGLGKDFVSAFIALWFFCSRRPCKVITTSVDSSQLIGVLWGEIHRFIETSVIPLPLEVNQAEIYHKVPIYSKMGRVIGYNRDPLSYIKAKVAKKAEGLLGHHVATDSKLYNPRTLLISDESSGQDDDAWEKTDTWAHRKLAIGNCFPCTNFFYRGVKKGSIKADLSSHYHVRVIRIRAEDSPNVQLAHAEIASGRQPSLRILIPGVVDYPTYVFRRKYWDKMLQTIGLDAEFYEGFETLMYPPDWLSRAEEVALGQQFPRAGQCIGIDPAQGGDNSSWCVVDRRGMIDLRRKKTPDTAEISDLTIALGREYDVPPDRWVFDAGGGGREHADYLRRRGYSVKTIAFGSSPTDPEAAYQRGVGGIYNTEEENRQWVESRQTYFNKRAEMYGLCRNILNPSIQPVPYGMPRELMEQRRPDGGLSMREMLSLFPLRYDGEGKLYLPPKRKKSKNTESLVDLIGCSPDEPDSWVLANYGLTLREPEVIGAVVL